MPAAHATSPPDISIGLVPFVLLKIMPLIAPAAMLLAGSCFPLKYPMYELTPLYIIATTPAEFPRNGPLRVTPLSIALSLIFGGAPIGTLLIPSTNPSAPPVPRAPRYVIPVP